MKRASSRLVHLQFQKFHPKSSISLFSKHSITQFSSISSTDEQINHHPSKPHLKSHSTSQSSPFSRNPNRLLHNPSHNLSTLVNPRKPSSQLPSKQTKIKERSQIVDDFERAKTSEEMIKAFESMDVSFDHHELGLASLKIGLKLDEEGEYPEKVFDYANKSLKILDEIDNDSSLPLAMNLQLLGSACYNLNRFNESLGYLNRANRILGKLEETISDNDFNIKHVLHAVHLNLANTKNAMGRREDAIGNLKKCLEIKEVTLEKDSRELGNAYRDMAEAFVALLSFNEALPYCMKAIEIHKIQLGSNSVEVAHDRRLLGVIYTGLEEHGKALEQNQLSQKVLKNWGRTSDLLRAEIDAANMQIALGKFDEAINTLKGVVLQTDKESEERAMIFVSMAKALCNQEKFQETKRCLQMACGILDKKEKSSPLEVSEAYMEISMQYETMNEFETAISLLKRAQAMLEKIPEEQHSVGSASARIGWLLLLTGKVQESVPYLEDATERLKENFGSKHFGVGYVYNNLGAAYALAINFQEKAIDAWSGHGPSAHDELKEARRVLEELKVKACGGSEDLHSKKALPVQHRRRSSRSSGD
ncbi:Tetratricopeptide-like helical [Cynara cardunculus var. scolymus]|uniref:Tetratricopeptide-like helical n=1 Tax=Cynara cardunculus var. scolymus TaxID=59895 RepID=A0A118JVU4_CYNCS|nr:Tetratricopeptide-like helical [Cynara cardunculus var. scolymus]